MIQSLKPKWFNAIVAGSSIPEWFIHRSVGNSIILKLPSDFPDFYYLSIGYCAVLGKENLSRWHSDHIWLGFAYIDDVLGHRPQKRVNHLKFSFDGYVEKGPLVVKEWGIRLLYVDYHTGEESDTVENIESDTEEEFGEEPVTVENIESDTEEEFDTVNATVLSPAPAVCLFMHKKKPCGRKKKFIFIFSNLINSFYILFQTNSSNDT